MRQATIARGTKETTISVSINLDGTGKYDIKTGVGFFDHMLEQLSRHSLVDMTIRADGDTHIDDHHTTEDVGIALGQAFKEALGDMSGITRYADTHLAMDEALTRVALDVSGRPFLVWQVDFPRDKVGTFDVELFEEFFRAFAMNAGFTLHIANLYGTNCHHIAETCFKAVARTVRTAIEPDPRQSGRVPTTKGQLGG
ncbi:imidazoleglycerol-phosphate dehydratase HisB [Pseudovibrio ascidiaceicola]|jgi:imidazoleglycerol-phosphate dehydratase|uniref:Imidazoleglycerol-phosphate dehydratase n=3 Tax=Pseudovibrio TaxID=258255 RepID=A0A1I7B1D1_9HYPH|nr:MULTISPECIES: imidazoleglycerol-phosphate dehydratase HisB [Pseudovibrio]EEA95432.1 imidazoleglycerol-phosphate dehydratase [Pseudovibrio sp. JE062]KZL20020.1 Imidazoleglycerol-phosphate dehydratase [Pseudovibrio sp. WM33]QUS56040.1 imidazoleglycerol-phosphate dehydratase HisB [Pseudovibrio brasiliensis]SFJ97182.1 imidazoleglycerol-phosphate dehydratase [Pseudovibrio ascidiaceicola]SFT80952.1 imidazoleglycerol-phosphate dehydratase [Pseudovibrio denitrificans]